MPTTSSGPFQSKGVGHCLTYVEDLKGQNPHNYPERKSALHCCRVLRTTYKFRSARGAVHIDPDYTANHLDARFVLEASRWVLGELLRVCWTGDRAEVARQIRELLSFEVPAIGEVDGELLVHRMDLSTAEEVLLLLHHAGEQGMSRRELGRFVQRSSSAVTKALSALASADVREVRQLGSGSYRLTDLGTKRVLSELGEKLTVQPAEAT